MANKNPAVKIQEQAKRKGMDFREFCSLAGKKAKGKPKRIRITEKRTCRESKCPLWDVCFVKYVSATKYGGRCALFHMPARVKDIIISSFEKGEDGMNAKIKELLNEIQIDLRKDSKPSYKLKLLKAMIDAKKAIYGDKQRVEANIQGEDPFGIGRMLEIIREQEQEE